jgi:hypothetical protein
VRGQPSLESGREGRLVTGRLIGRVAILGWLCTVATVVLSGHHAPATSTQRAKALRRSMVRGGSKAALSA